MKNFNDNFFFNVASSDYKKHDLYIFFTFPGEIQLLFQSFLKFFV